MFNDDFYQPTDDEVVYLTSDVLLNLHKKDQSINIEFDYSMNHIQKATEVELQKIQEKKSLYKFSFYEDLDTCTKYNGILHNKKSSLDFINEKAVFKKMPIIDLKKILIHFRLDDTKDEFKPLLQKLYNQGTFEFFLPPLVPSSISNWKNLKDRTFSGKIESFLYLVINKLYIPVVCVKNEYFEKFYYSLDYFLTVWDYSIQLISGFFKEVEKNKIFINNIEYTINQYLPEFITEFRHFKNNEYKIKSISGRSIDITNGKNLLNINIEDLADFFCKQEHQAVIGKVKLTPNTNFLLDPYSDPEIFTINKILKHKNNNFTITYFRNTEEIILKQKDFSEIYIEKGSCSYNDGIIKNKEKFDFSYKARPNIPVEVVGVFQNLISEKYFIKINKRVEDLNFQLSDFFELTNFEEMLEDKNEGNYKYKINYSDVIPVDDVFFQQIF